MTRRWIALATVLALLGVAVLVIGFSRVIPQFILRAQVREGRAVMRLLLTALEDAKAAEQHIDALMAERILSSARLIAQLPQVDRNTLLNAAHLNGWIEAELVDPNSRVVVSSRGYQKSPVPSDSLHSFWVSGRPEGVLLLGEDTLVVMVRRSNQTLLLVMASLTSLRTLKTRLGIASTIRKLGEAKGVRYVAFQTPDGILYAYPEEVTLSAIQSDPFLKDRLTRRAQGYRILQTLGTHILEFVAPYEEEGGEWGLLRLGWDLQDYQGTVTRIRLMSVLLILISLLIVFLIYRLMESQRRLQHQKAIAKLQEEIRQQTLDALPLGILEISQSGAVLYINTTARSFFGNQPEAVLPPTADPFQVRDVFRHRTTRQGEIFLQGRWISYLTVPMDDRVMVILEDRTEQHVLQERLQHAQEREVLTQFVAGIAHEIRSPLNALSLRVQTLLLDENLSEEYRHTLQEALAQIHRLEDAIRRILDLARPVQPMKEPVNLREWLAPILSDFALRAQRQEKTLQTVWDAPEDHTLSIDPKGMREVMENLLENALEATKAGDRVTVQVEATESATVIHVEDTGPGIPPDLKDRIFEPHVSTKPGGLGLGLYLVKRMVEAHGGRVEVDSRPGQGTRFTLYIPHESTHR